ncbi:hypothetical protein LCGC14_1207690 [marine sediment metagenome]|uniref:Uncharacterized protein n=1 Tax=marine sediment metagenome TaxID=412755 RepID=A0A0F9PJP1_9ZZZZ
MKLQYKSPMYDWITATIAVVALLAVMAMALVGCATVGIGSYPADQAVLEAAAGVMALKYLDIRKDGSLSKVDIANALLKVGDEAVQSQGYVSFTSLIQSRINAVTGGRMNPQVLTIYMLTIAVLESRADETAFGHILMPAEIRV